MKKINYLTIIAATMFAFSNMSYSAEKTKPQSSVEKPSIEMMNSRMTELQQEMTRINNTKDSKQKKALLEKHMKNMQTQMNMMGQMTNDMGMMGSNMGNGQMMGQMQGMMGQMMGQMQEHMNSCPFTQDSKKK